MPKIDEHMRKEKKKNAGLTAFQGCDENGVDKVNSLRTLLQVI